MAAYGLPTCVNPHCTAGSAGPGTGVAPAPYVATKVPFRSTTRWVAADVNKQTALPAPTGTTAALATTSPGSKLTFDASGRAVPHGKAVTKPRPRPPATVMFKAATPVGPLGTGTVSTPLA